MPRQRRCFEKGEYTKQLQDESARRWGEFCEERNIFNKVGE